MGAMPNTPSSFVLVYPRLRSVQPVRAIRPHYFRVSSDLVVAAVRAPASRSARSLVLAVDIERSTYQLYRLINLR